MAKYRSGRINEEMKKEISSIVMNGLKDPRITAMVTITDVEVTSDLRYAKVFVSIFGTETQKADSLEALKSSAGFIRREVGKRIQLRYVPELIITVDDTIDRGMHIDELIRKANEKKES
ncbi:30S ribosome-binding factor RbfA [Proteiniclasticum sp. BAD-10]|uniref:Ribosome-binding factor A n=1 Tax=Proteiniclasticum sediminis TaxID=2804028 RepID=A0A941CPN5_9CLOT|nr:30S ribosome-binding factor RbfA [Proteiniclasticum sediminis]MBR0575498.1 30S ribosome-binding factor RbfA [Proteiniclasticum sediminis]